ncbi:flagellar biosynthesis protein FlhB [Marinobacter xestospongiae]|uniref:flagellar biosynthesis protein FlhB n=1 Tax=Marinobacter xestospongiae TaxID=994319 RepID=UPI0020031AF1|nr:flagellar biosynthesis protein FlhB [Marinobacter xestospongiae]MCK7567338.1 flagellar biosynthesis protein FlhB [Marinobacter xestospongiae]
MSENDSSQDKSEEPTEQRLRKAREEGQIARSRELQSAALVGIGGVLLLMSSFLTQFARDLMVQHFELDRAAATDPAMMLQHLGSALELGLGAMLPFLITLWLIGAVSGMVPGGWLTSGKAIQPQLKRLNPLSGLKRMFSSQSLVELAKSSLKVVLLFGVMVWLLWTHADDLVAINRLPLGAAIGEGVRLLGLALMAMGLVLLFIALLDVPYQRWSMVKKLKMTKQEVKDEHKNTEGRPEVKQRIREIQMQMSRQRIDQRVPEADVVITNPTHYAVAIRYAPDTADAPYVIAKGVDDLALRIRDVATKNNKTILELPELTRAVYHSTRIDQEIPAGLFNAVAHVLMYVMQLNAWKARRGHKPAPLPRFQIPDSLRK